MKRARPVCPQGKDGDVGQGWEKKEDHGEKEEPAPDVEKMEEDTGEWGLLPGSRTGRRCGFQHLL